VEKPADLPVMQRSVFLSSSSTANGTGADLDIPATLIARADEMIERAVVS
jgi:hypothetical protein